MQMLLEHLMDLFISSVLQPERSQAKNLQVMLNPMFQAQEIVSKNNKYHYVLK
jgi:hypothetical protein